MPLCRMPANGNACLTLISRVARAKRQRGTRARQKLFRLCNDSGACILATRGSYVHSVECTELEAASEPRTWHEQVSAPSTSINSMQFRMQPAADPLFPKTRIPNARATSWTEETSIRPDHFVETGRFRGDFSPDKEKRHEQWQNIRTKDVETARTGFENVEILYRQILISKNHAWLYRFVWRVCASQAC